MPSYDDGNSAHRTALQQLTARVQSAQKIGSGGNFLRLLTFVDSAIGSHSTVAAAITAAKVANATMGAPWADDSVPSSHGSKPAHAHAMGEDWASKHSVRFSNITPFPVLAQLHFSASYNSGDATVGTAAANLAQQRQPMLSSFGGDAHRTTFLSCYLQLSPECLGASCKHNPQYAPQPSSALLSDLVSLFLCPAGVVVWRVPCGVPAKAVLRLLFYTITAVGTVNARTLRYWTPSAPVPSTAASAGGTSGTATTVINIEDGEAQAVATRCTLLRHAMRLILILPSTGESSCSSGLGYQELERLLATNDLAPTTATADDEGMRDEELLFLCRHLRVFFPEGVSVLREPPRGTHGEKHIARRLLMMCCSAGTPSSGSNAATSSSSLHAAPAARTVDAVSSELQLIDETDDVVATCMAVCKSTRQLSCSAQKQYRGAPRSRFLQEDAEREIRRAVDRVLELEFTGSPDSTIATEARGQELQARLHNAATGALEQFIAPAMMSGTKSSGVAMHLDSFAAEYIKKRIEESQHDIQCERMKRRLMHLHQCLGKCGDTLDAMLPMA